MSAERFLNGRVIVRQPEAGFRAGLDAVMLAAAVPEWRNGAGTGRGRRHGQPVSGGARAGHGHYRDRDRSDLVRLANDNAAANGMQAAFALPPPISSPCRWNSSATMTACLSIRRFMAKDRPRRSGPRPRPDGRGQLGGLAAGRAETHRLRRLLHRHPARRPAERGPGGAARRASASCRYGPEAGEAAKRVLVQARKGSKAPFPAAAGPGFAR